MAAKRYEHNDLQLYKDLRTQAYSDTVLFLLSTLHTDRIQPAIQWVAKAEKKATKDKPNVRSQCQILQLFSSHPCGRCLYSSLSTNFKTIRQNPQNQQAMIPMLGPAPRPGPYFSKVANHGPRLQGWPKLCPKLGLFQNGSSKGQTEASCAAKTAWSYTPLPRHWHFSGKWALPVSEGCWELVSPVFVEVLWPWPKPYARFLRGSFIWGPRTGQSMTAFR